MSHSDNRINNLIKLARQNRMVVENTDEDDHLTKMAERTKEHADGAKKFLDMVTDFKSKVAEHKKDWQGKASPAHDRHLNNIDRVLTRAIGPLTKTVNTKLAATRGANRANKLFPGLVKADDLRPTKPMKKVDYVGIPQQVKSPKGVTTIEPKKK